MNEFRHIAPRVAGYGSWKSPITPTLIVSEAVRRSSVMADGKNIYWLEGRPVEGGRQVVVRRLPNGDVSDVVLPPFNARSRIYEYGGCSYIVSQDTVYFSNFDDQRIYRRELGHWPVAITPNNGARYTDFAIDKIHNRLICVRETPPEKARDPLGDHELIAIDLGHYHPPLILDKGRDFYSSPNLSHDGSRLAWLCWDHPNMPWDGTELWAGELNSEGGIKHAWRVAGGVAESIFQPQWSEDGFLYFVSDRNGWWNLYRWDGKNIEAICEMQAEFGVPQWVGGMSTYGFASADRIICSYSRNGLWHLGSIDLKAKRLERIGLPFTDIHDVRVTQSCALFCAGSPTTQISVVRLDMDSGSFEILRPLGKDEIAPEYYSAPQQIAYLTEGGLTAHALYYPPSNRDYVGPDEELPPLLVTCHGGPTAATKSSLNLGIQFWTSRGIAVLDVNYGGSSGYGRAYRERLNGNWGVVDVADCVNGARYLVAHGLVDGNRLAIRGTSAGGYTVLCALTFYNVFKAGASYYGISDLEALIKDTHKFESRYMDRLIGPYPLSRETYVQRSPIHFAERISCPVIFFQGLEDKVVPPNQAEAMVKQLRKKGLPVTYITFEGEGHGFRQADNIKYAFKAELQFYAQILGFDLAVDETFRR